MSAIPLCGQTGRRSVPVSHRATDPTPAAAADRLVRRGIVLALLSMAQLMFVVDTVVVNVALPAIQGSLQLSVDALSWAVNAYALSFGGLLLLGGRLADRLGRRRLFVTGLWLFLAGSLGCALSGTAPQLIAGRILQGTGAALAAPAALALITVTFVEGPERNRAIAIWGAVAGAGGAVGVLLGGLLTGIAGWPAIFLVNVPGCLGAIWLAPSVLPGDPAPSGRPGGRIWPEVAVAASATAGLMLLIYALSSGAAHGWGGAGTPCALLAAALLLARFWRAQHRTDDPLIPIELLASRFTGSVVAVAALATAPASARCTCSPCTCNRCCPTRHCRPASPTSP